MRGWRGDDIDCKGSEGELRGGLAKFKLTVHGTPGSRVGVHSTQTRVAIRESKQIPFPDDSPQRFVRMSGKPKQ